MANCFMYRTAIVSGYRRSSISGTLRCEWSVLYRTVQLLQLVGWLVFQIVSRSTATGKVSDLKHPVTGSVADPGSGDFFTPGSGMGKNPDPGYGMNIPDHFSESLETDCRAKNTEIL